MILVILGLLKILYINKSRAYISSLFPSSWLIFGKGLIYGGVGGGRSVFEWK